MFYSKSVSTNDGRRRFSRREIFHAGMSTAAALRLQAAGQTARLPTMAGPAKPQAPVPSILSPEDDHFLEELEKANFLFFIEQADPATGLVKDRCNVRTTDQSIVGSIAATGFGLTAICIGHRRGYISENEAYTRVLNTLRFLYEKMPNHRGFYFHFANIKTGERIWESEISSIDTAILLCGVLTSRQSFRHSEITRLAIAITSRVEWAWLSEDTSLVSLGWSPERGFLPYRWDYYSELMMIYLVGIGSATHALPPESWNAWKRTTFEYAGLRYIGSFAPLFVNQYSQAWFDFRGKRDQYADYFLNSIYATEVHRLFCLEMHKDFPDYSDDLWGITASDSEHGYVVWGGPPAIGPIDGTVVPSAAGGSLPFLPQATLRVLKNMKNRYGDRAWCRYGFVNAFNPLNNWYDDFVVGIDTGITMLMAENLRTSFVWNMFMTNPEAERGLQKAGFKSYSIDYQAVQAKLEGRTK
ncbi:MAG: hypothetical protein JO319_21240 [Acidobacteriaceae bacterium]|nr:hypothetical protein [Acidobacteriaceae bacterium]